MRKVAVTGGLASGKSTVCLLFKKAGAFTVSADTIAHRLLSPKTSVGKEVIRLLGPEILEGEEIERARVASLVFPHPEVLKELEALLHPHVREEIDKEYHEAVRQKAPLFIAEVPLLFESGMDADFDETIAVKSPMDLRQKRYKGSDFLRRIERQLSDEERVSKASYVIENQGDITLLETQVNHIYSTLTRG